MAKVYFLLAGDRSRLSLQNDIVFLQSRNRVPHHPDIVFHRNDYSTVLSLPEKYFKEHFKYERSSGIYRTKLTWKDIPRNYIELWKHN